MKCRVAIIVERAITALGGAEQSVFELAEALSALGHEVHIVAATGQAESKMVRVLCKSTPGSRVGFRTFAAALRTYLAGQSYAIVHSVLPFDFADVYQPRGGTYAETILRNAASYPCPVLRRLKRLSAFANTRRLTLLTAERRLCRAAQGPVIAALSQYVVEQLIRHYLTDPSRIVLVHNGVKVEDSGDTDASRQYRAGLLKQFGSAEADRPILFLFAAHNFRLKGLEPLITALHAAVSHDTVTYPLGLVVAGNGDRTKYERLAHKLNVEHRVAFLGSVPQIRTVLAAADVAVLPTFYDPASRFILEALAFGKPVITTRYNGATDLFVADRHGIVLDAPDDAGALAEALLHFAEPGNIRKASQAILDDQLKDHVSIARVAREFSSLYESILRGKKK